MGGLKGLNAGGRLGWGHLNRSRRGANPGCVWVSGSRETVPHPQPHAAQRDNPRPRLHVPLCPAAALAQDVAQLLRGLAYLEGARFWCFLGFYSVQGVARVGFRGDLWAWRMTRATPASRWQWRPQTQQQQKPRGSGRQQAAPNIRKGVRGGGCLTARYSAM